MNRHERRRKQRQERRPTPPAARAPVDAGFGWTVAGDGRTVVGVCECGEAATVDCPVCGPQCQQCFTEAGRPF